MMTGPRVIGMIGGMSWESSAQYYRLANELVRDRLDPPILLRSKGVTRLAAERSWLYTLGWPNRITPAGGVFGSVGTGCPRTAEGASRGGSGPTGFPFSFLL